MSSFVRTNQRCKCFCVLFGWILLRADAFVPRPFQRPLPVVGFSSTKLRKSILHATVPTEEDEVAPSMTQPKEPVAPDMEAYARGYQTVFEELPCRSCSPSVGSIPSDLVGTYFRSGPAMFSAGSLPPPKKSIVQPRQPPCADGKDAGRLVEHPFEGDGGVVAVTFSDDGEVTARFRFIRTVGFETERKKGQRVYTGMDSSRELPPAQAAGGLGNDLPLPLYRHHLMPGFNKLRKNTANTRAVYWGKRLISLWEGGQPYKIDALALSTEGRSRLGGAIKEEEDPFGGAMVYDPVNDHALFYSVIHGPTKSEFTLFEFNSDFRLVSGGRTSWDLPGFALITDFGATENYAVVVQPNIVAKSTIKYLVEQAPGKILEAKEDSAAVVHLIPRRGASKQLQSFNIPADGMTVEGEMQIVNAYEEGGKVVMDVIRSDGSRISSSAPPSWPWGSTLEEYQSIASKKSLWRYTIDTQTNEVTRRLLSDSHGMFGVVNPSVSTQKHRYIYMSVGSLGSEVAPPQGLGKFDCETEQLMKWMPERYEFCGEPMFAPKKASASEGEDNGYILSLLYNGKSDESEIIVLDAQNLSDGPIARVPLGMAIPHGLFGCFTSAEEATWTTDTIRRRAKLHDKMEAQGNQWNEVKSDFSGLGLRFDDMEEYFGDFFG